MQKERLKDFFTTFPKTNYSAGEIVLEAGAQPEGIYYMQSGMVRQYDIAQNGDEIVVNILRPGAHFLMSWVLNQEPNRWFFDCIGDVTLHCAPLTTTDQFLKDSPDLLYAYVKRMCSGASGQQRRMAHLMGGSARTRVLFELITMSNRFGEPHEGGTTIQTTDAELAAMSGLSREAVSRELAKLKHAGILTRDYGSIHIPDPSVLIGELNDQL